MLEDGLVALLNLDATTTALVAGRIYPVQGPPDNAVFPYITYQDAAGSSEYTFSGAELRTKRIQFDLWGVAYGDGKAMIKALRNVLAGYSGTLSEGTRVLFAARLNEMDNFDVDSRSYRSIAEYEFQISEQ